MVMPKKMFFTAVTLVGLFLMGFGMHVQAETQSQIFARSEVDRPDDSNAYQLHLLYLVPADGVDHAYDTNGDIARSVAAMQNWMAQRTGGITFRMDTIQGELDVTFVQLNRTQADLASYNAFIRDELEAMLIDMGFNHPRKIYLAFYDGFAYETCGGAAFPPELVGNLIALYMDGQFADSSIPPCSESLVFSPDSQQAGYLEMSLLHEVFHILGAVSECGLNYIDGGHTNDDPGDLMYAGNAQWQPNAIDVGNDDYWGHGIPDCLDISNSVFLDPLPPKPEIPAGWVADEIIATDVCSVSDDAEAQVKFYNNSGSPVEIYWVDYDCQEVWYAELAPEELYVQQTYVTHPWRIRNAATGALLIEFVPDEAGSYNVTITQ